MIELTVVAKAVPNVGMDMRLRLYVLDYATMLIDKLCHFVQLHLVKKSSQDYNCRMGEISNQREKFNVQCHNKIFCPSVMHRNCLPRC